MSPTAARSKSSDFTYSLGLSVAGTGVIGDVLWEGPAFKQSIVAGQTIVAVNGTAYETDLLKKAVTAAKGNGPAIELLLKNGDRYRTVKLDYHGGLRYPHLEPLGKTPAGLDALLAPRT